MIPVVISGGSGTRLWPVSRASYPKQFCEFYDRSFLLNTIMRLKNFNTPVILTVESMRSLTSKALRTAGIQETSAIYEPMGKNTAPAIALLCKYFLLNGKANEVVGVFPSDHLVGDETGFLKTVAFAEKCAQENLIVTLGIRPTEAATGYGYIEVISDAHQKADGLKSHRVKAFLEKPVRAKAEQFVASGNHFWNSGMFIFKVSKMIESFKAHMPDLWEKINTLDDLGPGSSQKVKYLYPTLASESIDYGIMEKEKDILCIPSDFGWSDVGSWDEVARLQEEYAHLQTSTAAQVFNVDALNNFVFSFRNKAVGLIGVNDLVIVDTPDALLISKKGQTQKVKNLVDEIKAQGLSVATEHPFEIRPWGGFEVLSDAEEFKAKTIIVEPGAQLSYQSHKQRAEHWIIVKGIAEVTLDDKVIPLKVGEHIFIPKGSKHRIKNTGAQNLQFVEVQTGTYFGEDDIVRYQDDYNRT
jgi:mannose-1-phosphate guanylyltransferase/mannose-6-phosphate isomerase